jgi:hypothetical protein
MVALNPCTHSHSFIASLFFLTDQLLNSFTVKILQQKHQSTPSVTQLIPQTKTSSSLWTLCKKSHALQSDYVKWGVLSFLPPKLFQRYFISLETTTMLFPCLILQWLQSATHGKFLWRNWDIQE